MLITLLLRQLPEVVCEFGSPVPYHSIVGFLLLLLLCSFFCFFFVLFCFVFVFVFVLFCFVFHLALGFHHLNIIEFGY